MDLALPFFSDIDSFTVLYYVLTALVHVAFAAGVARDAGLVVNHRGDTILVGPFVWVFATLVGGVLIGIGYWAIHHVLAPYQKGQHG